MDLFKLFGQIVIDNEEANKNLDETSKKGQKAEGKLSKTFNVVGKGAAVAGKAIVKGMAVGGAAVGALATKAIQSYAEYEQLIGGVETLFGAGGQSMEDYAASVGQSVDSIKKFQKEAGIAVDGVLGPQTMAAIQKKYDSLMAAQDKVAKNANIAYRTAGMSANDYMETVTSFSASLIGSLGGDTEKAAALADQAIIDMSDNANKMGTDITSIQNAYQGFAKQNYTMLDNLKLGYGGTKEEMQRLLKDAEKLTGKKFDISNFADITEAIHAIQEEMGIAGTTANEASTTISGSISSMKASWENLLTAIAADDLPFDQYVDDFVTSVSTVADNLIPRIGIALEGVVNLVSQLAPIIIEKLPGLFEQILPPLIEGATGLVQALVDAAPGIMEVLINCLPALLEAVTTLFTAVMTALPELIQIIVDALPAIFDTLIAALPTVLPALIDGVVALIVGLIAAAGAIIQPIIDYLPEIIVSIVNALLANLPALLEGLVQLVGAIVVALPEIYNALVIALDTLLDGWIASLIQWAAPLIEAIAAWWDGVKESASQKWEEIKTAVSTKVTELKTAASQKFAEIKTAISTKWEEMKMAASQKWGSIKTAISNAWEGIKSGVSTAINNVKTTVSNVWNTIKSTASNVWNGIKSTISGAWTGIKSGVSSAINGVKSTVSSVFDSVKTKVTNVWNSIKSAIKTPIEEARDLVGGAIDTIKGFFNFEFKWPDIKMPHFGITPSGWKIGDLLEGSIPKLGIEWYAKGGVMKRPTLFDYNPTTGEAKVGGEAGAEAVAPIDTLQQYIRAAVQAENTKMAEMLQRIIDMLAQFFPDALEAMNQVMVLDTGVLVAETAPAMDAELGRITLRKGRGR